MQGEQQDQSPGCGRVLCKVLDSFAQDSYKAGTGESVGNNPHLVQYYNRQHIRIEGVKASDVGLCFMSGCTSEVHERFSSLRGLLVTY